VGVANSLATHNLRPAAHACLWPAVGQVSLMLHLDDPLDAIAVHCWNGTWGLIAPGLFSTQVFIQVCAPPPSFELRAVFFACGQPSVVELSSAFAHDCCL